MWLLKSVTKSREPGVHSTLMFFLKLFVSEFYFGGRVGCVETKIICGHKGGVFQDFNRHSDGAFNLPQLNLF